MNKINNTIKYTSLIFATFAIVFFFGARNASAACDGPVTYGSSIWGCVGDSGNDDEDDNNNDNDDLNVSTLSASSIDTDSATLRGEITDIDSDNDYERYFEWGTDEDDLDHTLSVSGDTNDEGDFSRTLSGLSDDHEYFYRACAENVDNSNDDDCGSIRSFTTDEEDNDYNDNDYDNDGEGSVLTTDASAIGYNSAILNGVVVNDGGSQTVWFEWGTTTSLGNRTNSRTVSNDQSMVSISLSGLSSGTSYFFRLVSGDGDIGDMKAFTTRSSSGTTTTTTTTPPRPTTVTISSDQYLNVDLVASAKDVKSGDTVMYQAVYENLTNTTLKNINLIIDFPVGISIENTESGTIVGQRIELVIPSIAPKAKSSFAIETSISTKSSDKFLVGIIEAVYDHPNREDTRIDVVDYAIVKVMSGSSGSGSKHLGASALFAGTFFPKSFGGWLILTASLILLIVLARKLYKEKEDKKKEESKVKPGLKIAK